MQSTQTINPAVMIPSKQEVKARLQKELEDDQQQKYLAFTAEVVRLLNRDGFAEVLIPDVLANTDLFRSFTKKLQDAKWIVTRDSISNSEKYLNVY